MSETDTANDRRTGAAGRRKYRSRENGNKKGKKGAGSANNCGPFSAGNDSNLLEKEQPLERDLRPHPHNERT
jgi:hypothetical protein